MKYYLEPVSSVFESLSSTEDGLHTSFAENRLSEEGNNELEREKKKSLLARFLSQLLDPMVIVLIVAAVVSGVFKETADMVIILTVVLLNGVLGVIQEGKAEKAIEALQQMSSPFSRVRRDGIVRQIKSEEIVRGDVVLLEAGDSVPADMRLILAASLRLDEASLTGESVPVEKNPKTLPDTGSATPLGDRLNMAYMGSSVVYGRGEGVVTRTGMDTEMGKIAGIITGAATEKTPLQKKLAQLSGVLSIGVLLICVFIFLFSVFKNGGFSGGHVLEMFMTAVSLAVAAIPEGLVAVVTILLSIGVTKMSRKNAIIRRLTAVETLGCTQIICSDKTGTLTQNKMKVVQSSANEEKIAVSMCLCCDAQLAPDLTIVGEPTEAALVQFALDKGFDKNKLEEQMPRVGEAPFDSMRKMMSTVHKQPSGRYVQYTKGAPDQILQCCAFYAAEEGILPLSEEKREQILAQNSRMAEQALRVLAVAMKTYKQLPSSFSPEALETDLIYVGLTGMIDPVRPEILPAIEKCRSAGIRPVMITGDHKDTATAIARQLGILTDESQAITGAELDEITDSALEREIVKYSVYARVQPEHKVRIVNAWKQKGKITAMTGDGVNDAPALKEADIGVGMGITGTDVTKNVADMVLADDNFATIVSAVEEGRRIYDNIRKAIQFLLGSNLSEVLALFVATLVNVRLFLPIHILWINLITDSFPAIALGMEEAEKDSMERPPRDPKEGIFASGVGVGVLYQGTLIAILTLLAYFIGSSVSHMLAMTMAFFTLSMSEVFHSLNLRSREKSIFTLTQPNQFVYLAMAASFILTMAVVYIPGLNTVFSLTALPMKYFLIAFGLSVSVIPIVELVKLAQRKIKRS